MSDCHSKCTHAESKAATYRYNRYQLIGRLFSHLIDYLERKNQANIHILEAENIIFLGLLLIKWCNDYQMYVIYKLFALTNALTNAFIE